MCQSIILALPATKHSKFGENRRTANRGKRAQLLNIVFSISWVLSWVRLCRYLINDTYWDKHNDSPIFFYTGNEGNIELFAQNTGFMWEIAEEFKATLGLFARER